jgi:transposase-like protein
MEPTTYKHMDNVECPHCKGHELSLVAYAFDNGSAKWSEFRCSDCSSHWRVNRQYKISEIFFLGKTAAEIRHEITHFAALQSAMSELHLHNADEDAFRMLAR